MIALSLERQADGRFKDEDLARILQDATQHSAAAFKARGIPDVLRVVEIMGMEQARSWGVCTLNEFRKVSFLKDDHSELSGGLCPLRQFLGLKRESGSFPCFADANHFMTSVSFL